MSTNNTELQGAIPEAEMERIYKEAEDFIEVEKSKGLPAKDWIRVGVAYCAGKISEYYRKLTQTKAPVLRWVKASEGKPKESLDDLSCKIRDERCVLRFFDDQFHFYSVRHDRYLPYATLCLWEIEWLEESIAPDANVREIEKWSAKVDALSQVVIKDTETIGIFQKENHSLRARLAVREEEIVHLNAHIRDLQFLINNPE